MKDVGMFDILYGIHVSVWHCGSNIMVNEVPQKYKNIAQESRKESFGMQVVLNEIKFGQKDSVVKPILSNEMYSRCQFDLIDLQRNPDDYYKLILIYQDYQTKFVQFRLLNCKTAEKVTKLKIDIFYIFRALSILQSDNVSVFVNKVVENLRSMWTALKIIHEKLRHIHSQGNVERAIQGV